MIFIHYENYNGGVNNICVATDSATLVTGTSTKGREAAERNLKRALRRRAL